MPKYEFDHKIIDSTRQATAGGASSTPKELKQILNELSAIKTTSSKKDPTFLKLITALETLVREFKRTPVPKTTVTPAPAVISKNAIETAVMRAVSETAKQLASTPSTKKGITQTNFDKVIKNQTNELIKALIRLLGGRVSIEKSSIKEIESAISAALKGLFSKQGAPSSETKEMNRTFRELVKATKANTKAIEKLTKGPEATSKNIDAKILAAEEKAAKLTEQLIKVTEKSSTEIAKLTGNIGKLENAIKHLIIEQSKKATKAIEKAFPSSTARISDSSFAPTSKNIIKGTVNVSSLDKLVKTTEREFEFLSDKISKLVKSLPKESDMKEELSGYFADLKRAYRTKGPIEIEGFVKAFLSRQFEGLREYNDSFKLAAASLEKFRKIMIESGTYGYEITTAFQNLRTDLSMFGKDVNEATGDLKKSILTTVNYFKRMMTALESGAKNLEELGDIKIDFSELESMMKLGDFSNLPQAAKDLAKIWNVSANTIDGLEAPLNAFVKSIYEVIKKTKNVKDSELVIRKTIETWGSTLTDHIDTLKEGTKTQKKLTETQKKLISEAAQRKGEIISARDMASRSMPGSKRYTMADRVKELRSQQTPFKEQLITPGGMVFKDPAGGYGKDIRKAVQSRVNELSKSLALLQNDIIKSLEKGFDEHKKRWKILSKGFEPEFIGSDKKMAKEWRLQIVNMGKLQTELNRMSSFYRQGPAVQDPTQMVNTYIKERKLEIESQKSLAKDQATLIGEWLKGRTFKEIENLSVISEASKKDLQTIKTKFKEEKGKTVGKEMRKALVDALGDRIKNVFTETFAADEIQKELMNKGFIRTLALPAAGISKTGTTMFKTKHGSERALPRFATYKTGFENLYDKMMEAQVFPGVSGQAFAGEIHKLPLRPKKEALKEAQELSKKLLTQYAANVSELDTFLKDQYKEAAVLVGAKLERAGTGRGLVSFTADIDSAINRFKTDTMDKVAAVNEFMDKMESLGITAYDVVKSLESIKFENVYDIYRKILAQPVEEITKAPQFVSRIRNFEEAMRQVREIMPVVEPGRPRRGKHQEDTLITLFQTSPLWRGSRIVSRYGGPGGEALKPREQQQRIQDINLNIRDMLNEYKELRNAYDRLESAASTPEQLQSIEKQIPTIFKRRARMAVAIPRGIERISSLGITEEQASKYEEFRPGGVDYGKRFFEKLNATMIKMYTENLLSQAPFGEFNRLGRQTSYVTAAMSSMESAIEGFEGAIRTEVPSFRTTRERDLIASGRQGAAGYGFNVLAELHHSAGTFEDQMIISGKLAKALTQAVSTLVKPGRPIPPIGSEKVTEIEKKVLRDISKDVSTAAKEIMQILGVPQEYEKEADKALIEEVRKTTVIMQGKPIEVQEAKLAEAFLNYFGRKFTTRYASKGVSVMPTKGGGIGIAEMPKTMGRLASEIIDAMLAGTVRKKALEFEIPEAGYTFPPEAAKVLQDQLIRSGNKFIISMFSDASDELAKSMGVKEEIQQQAEIYKKFTGLIKHVYSEELPKDVKGIEKLKDIYKYTAKEPKLTEPREIDIRISARGIAKRGLQGEFLENIIGNVIGISPGALERGAVTTVQPKMKESVYEKLLGGPGAGTTGEFASLSKALGFERATTEKFPEIRENILKRLKAQKGKPETEEDRLKMEALADRAAAFEAVSSYYVKVKDEYGKETKKLVGPKFVQIIEEPHQFKQWQKGEIEKTLVGEKLNLPAYAAYAAIFGEQSALMKEIDVAYSHESKKYMEYVRALEMMSSKKIPPGIPKVKLADLKKFTERRGVFTEEEENIDRLLKGTLMDIEKYPTPFTVDLPTGKDKPTEPFYVPGALARGVYKEKLVAGEFAMELPTRRLQDVIGAAKEVQEVITGEIFDEDIIRKALPARVAEDVKAARLKGLAAMKETFNRFYKGLADQPVEEAFRIEKFGKKEDIGKYAFAGEAYPEGITEQQYILEYLERWRGRSSETEAIDQALRRTADILIGVRPPEEGGKKEVRTELLAAKSRMTKELERGFESWEGGKYGRELVEKLGISLTDEDLIAKHLKKLQKAKIKYMQELAKMILGKTGAIGEVVFQRKIPAVYGKATVAITDRTKELEDFAKYLAEEDFEKSIESFIKPEDFKALTDALEDIRKEHTDLIEKAKTMGMPVLKEYELGISETIAKKIPVTFAKKWRKKGKAKLPKFFEDTEEISQTLYDLLEYRKKLTSYINATIRAQEKVDENLRYLSKEDKKEAVKKIEAGEKIKGLRYVPSEEDMAKIGQIQKFMREELQPYVETVRFPFTGVSSVQPYKAKLLESRYKAPVEGTEGEKVRDLARFAFMVPGVPEMRMFGEEGGKKGFVQIITELEGIRDAAAEARNALLEREDLGEAISMEELDKLSSLVRNLNREITDVIPKYGAIQQKLDFDGDAIEAHSATTVKARAEIEQHFKTFVGAPTTEGRGTIEAAWRAQRGWEEAKTGATSARYPLADILTIYEKKWEKPGAEYEFLKKPDITETLAYLKPEQRLEALGKGELSTIKSELISAIEEAFTGATAKAMIDAVDKASKEADANAKSLLNSVEGFSEDERKTLDYTVKEALYEKKYNDAILAQLFKLHTGLETESVYRLHRLGERAIGFGKGVIRPARGEEGIPGETVYRSTDEFKERWPVSKLFGKGDRIYPETEFASFMNELERFATQKGMDVKLAGDKAVAGEIVASLSRGQEGVNDLLTQIGLLGNAAEEDYEEIKDFAILSGKVIKERIGKLPTKKIMAEVRKIEKGRELEPTQMASRAEAIKRAVELVGFEGFLRELAYQIEKEAENALVAELESLTPEARRERKRGPYSGLPTREWAQKEIKFRREQAGGIDLPRMTRQTMPLYGFRSLGATPKSVTRQYRQRGGYIELPPGMENLDEELKEQYRQAVAVSASIRDTFKQAAEVQAGGAYSEMVLGTIENLQRIQSELDKDLKFLREQQYPLGEKRPMGGVPERVLALEKGEEADITQFARLLKGQKGDFAQMINSIAALKVSTKDVDGFLDSLGKLYAQLSEMKKRVDIYSDKVGIPPIREDIKRKIKGEFKEFEAFAEGIFKTETGDTDADDREIEKLKKAKEKYVEILRAKAEALVQMDKATEALRVRSMTEGGFLQRTFPSREAVAQARRPDEISTVIKKIPLAVGYAQQAAETAKEAAEAASEITGGIGDRGRTGLGGWRKGDDPVDVFLVGVAADVFKNVSLPSGTFQNVVGTAGAGRGAYDPTELGRFAKKMADEGEITQESFAKIYRASAIKGGGKYGYKDTFGEEFKEKQIEEIMKVMKGEEPGVSAYVESAGVLGEAIHAKLGEIERVGAEKDPTTKIELEKYIEILDDTFGTITGHIDIFQQKLAEDSKEVLENKVIDIKTVRSEMVERLKQLPTGIKLGELGKIEGMEFLESQDIRKLEEVASQLNIYMKGIEKATGVASEAIEAEAWFVDRDDIENITKISFGFDIERYKRDIAAIQEARSRISASGDEFAKMTSRESLQAKERRRVGKEPGERKGKLPLSKEEIDEFYGMARARFKEVEAFPGVHDKLRERASREQRKPPTVPTGAYGAGLEKYQFTPQPRPEDDLLALMSNLKTMHSLAQEYWKMEAGIGTTAGYESLHADIKEGLKDADKVGSQAASTFNEIVSSLRQGEEISGIELITAWKYYRIAVGNFFLKEAEKANELRMEMEKGGEDAGARQAYYDMEKNLRDMQKFMERGLGKRTDIYTRLRRFISPEFAMATGLYKSPQEMLEKAKMPLGDAPKLEKLFTKTVVGDVTEGKKLIPPIDKVREIFQTLTGSSQELNKEWIALLTKGEKFERLGETVLDAWELEGFVENIAKIRGSLETFLRFRFTEGEDIAERKNLEETLKLVRSVENAYAALNTERMMGKGLQGTRADWGQMALLKVPKFLPPQEQMAMHKRNIQQVREYFRKTEEKGGPEIGERYIYPIKIIGEAGDIVKNVAYDFKKYGDAVDYAGSRVGVFGESQRDLMMYMQAGNQTFKSAIMRAIRWGAASKLVYGGANAIVESIDLLADVETGLAQLRMVMSPLETDFDALGAAAIGFAKQYGVPMTDVLQGMRIFAQQGLKQNEVIDRTQTATLASNVTTLNATEATEALTAAMKIFRQEGEGSMRFMDAWSEVEAKHAITADKMANALKKAASAAKNAGFDFDELNGIITAIGSVTRQSGREIGTSLRFMFRRITSEKAPKELAKIGIPTITAGGELRRGFDVLSDLAMSWKDLTSAQRMNLAQSIGGTRQYNSLLVLMDNWGEALDTITDSVNSKGSAERRNLELMKTYNKQLEQMKAAAVEVHVAFGKIALPFGKAVVQSIRALLEVISETPAAIKYLAVGMSSFATYIIKGADAIDYFSDRWRQGKSIIDEITSLFGQELKITSFELFGKGEADFTKRLKTLGKYKINIPVTVGEGGKDQPDKFTEQGRRLKDFRSAGAKTVLWLKMLGESYNAFLADMVGTGKIIGDVKGPLDLLSKGLDTISQSLTEAAVSLNLMAVSGGLVAGISGMIVSVGAAATAAASDVSAVVGQAAGFAGEKFGEAGKNLVEKFASENTGLVAAVAPLAASIMALGPIIDTLSQYYNTISKSAQDYEKAAYGIRRAQDSELKTIRGLIGEYDSLQRSLDEIAKVSEPATKKRRQELETYESPLTLMTDATVKATEISNRLAETNIGLVVGYDKLGNAVLKTAGDFRSYLSVLEDLKLKEMAKTEVEVVVRFITDLTEAEGPEKWKYELRELAKEAPIIGNLLAKGIKISPAKAISVVTGRLNELLQAKNKFPMSTAFDKDIKNYQGKLREIKKGFNETYGDFKRILSNIETKGLSKDDIAKMFGIEKLRKGYELMIDVEPRFNLKETKGKVEWQDVLGAEVMRRAFPSFAATFDASSILTKARLETAGVVGREGKAISGDIIFFLDEIADKYGIAGNQAIISLKETTDGVFDWFVEYFNTKTLRIEEKPFTSDMQNMVESIFPVNRIEEELAERLDSLNAFVAGASAGLRGIEPKRFKKDFTLGERFFSEIPTTTILQGPQGFTPGGGFGESPYQKEWKETTETFFFKPMREYRLQMEQLQKLRLEGLQGGQVTLAKGLYDALTKLQNILKNNQVVLQYRAVFVDLMKSMEAGTRTLKENLAVEKSRQELQKGVSGYLKDVPTGLDNLDTGVQRFIDLTVKQRALLSRRGYEPAAVRLGELGIRKTAAEEQIFGMDRALVALQSISEVSKGFGAALTADEMKKYVEIIAQTDDKGAQSIAIETSKVVENTALTVERLDDIIANMGADGVVSKKLRPEEFGGLDFKAFISKMRENLPETKTSFFNQRNRLWGSENIITFNKDIQPLIDLQEKGNKDQWISSKDIAKTSAAITALASINRHGYDEIIEKLEAQKAQTKEGSKERQDIEAAIQQAREGALTEGVIGQETWKTTQAAAATTTAMTLFAREIGMTENEIKTLGVATAGLTVLFNKLFVKGGPEKGYQSGGMIRGPGGPKDDKIHLRASDGEYIIKQPSAKKLGYDNLDFMNEHGKLPTFAEGGVVGGVVGGTAAGDKPITVNISENTINRFKQVLLPYLAVTAVGYVAGKAEDETRLATLNAQAEEQSKLFAQILEKYPEASKKVIADLEAAKVDLDKITAETATIEKPLVLDTEKERRKVASDITSIRKELIKGHEKITEEMSEIADKLARLEIAEKFKMELEEMDRAIREIDIASNVGRAIESSLLNYDFTSAFGGGLIWRSLFDQWDDNISDLMEDRIGDAAGPKFPRAGGALAGRYKPKPIDYGIKGISGMTPEEYLVATDKRISYKPSTKQFFTQEVSGPQRGEAGVITLLKDVLAGRTAGISKVKSAEDMFRKLEFDQKKLNISQVKLIEYMSKREELRSRAGFFGSDLSVAEKEELAQLDKIIERLGDGLVELTDDISRAKDALKSSLGGAKDVIRETGNVFNNFNDALQFSIDRMYSTTSVLNRNLAGFPGSYELPTTRRDMSVEQYAYSIADDELKRSMEDYAYGLNVLLPSLRQQISVLKDLKTEAMEEPDVSRVKKLEEKIKVTTTAIDQLANTLGKLGTTLLTVNRVAGAMKTFGDAISDLNISEAFEDLPDMKKFREGMARFVGGGHPLARVTVTPEEEFKAAQVSVYLRNMQSTQFDKMRAELKYSLTRGGLSGEAAVAARRQLANLPTLRARKVAEYVQTQIEQPQLVQQQDALLRTGDEIQKILREVDLTGAQREQLTGIRDKIAEVLKESLIEMTTKEKTDELVKQLVEGTIPIGEGVADLKAVQDEGGEKQFKGIGSVIVKGILESFSSIIDELGDDPDANRILKGTLPSIHAELMQHTRLLEEIAKKSGVSPETIEKITGIKEKLEPSWFDKFKALVDPGTVWDKKQSGGRIFGEGEPSWFDKFKALVDPGTVWDKKQSGGRIFGEGGPREDKIPAMLSPGEYVIRAAAAQRIGYNALEAMNKHGAPVFQDGGTVPGFAEGGVIGNLTGKNVGNIAEFIKLMSEKRLKKADELYDAKGLFDPLKILGTQAALATGELATRLFIKTPADLVNLAAQVGVSLKEHGLFGTLGKGTSMVKTMASKEGLKAIGEMIKGDIKKGGLGVSTAILETVAGGATAFNVLKPGVGSKAVGLSKQAKSARTLLEKTTKSAPGSVILSIKERIKRPSLGKGKRVADTGKSLAKEFRLRYMGEMDGLEYFSMKIPHKGQIAEKTFTTKGVDRERLVQRMLETKKAFSVPSKPLEMKRIVRRGDPKAAFSRAQKLLKMQELGEKTPKIASKKLFTPDDIIKKLRDPSTGITDKAREYGKLMVENPAYKKALLEVKKTARTKYDEMLAAGDLNDIMTPAMDLQWSREALETMEALLDDTVENSMSRFVKKYRAGKGEIGEFAHGGAAHKGNVPTFDTGGVVSLQDGGGPLQYNPSEHSKELTKKLDPKVKRNILETFNRQFEDYPVLANALSHKDAIRLQKIERLGADPIGIYKRREYEGEQFDYVLLNNAAMGKYEDEIKKLKFWTDIGWVSKANEGSTRISQVIEHELGHVLLENTKDMLAILNSKGELPQYAKDMNEELNKMGGFGYAVPSLYSKTSKAFGFLHKDMGQHETFAEMFSGTRDNFEDLYNKKPTSLIGKLKSHMKYDSIYVKSLKNFANIFSPENVAKLEKEAYPDREPTNLRLSGEKLFGENIMGFAHGGAAHKGKEKYWDKPKSEWEEYAESGVVGLQEEGMFGLPYRREPDVYSIKPGGVVESKKEKKARIAAGITGKSETTLPAFPKTVEEQKAMAAAAAKKAAAKKLGDPEMMAAQELRQKASDIAKSTSFQKAAATGSSVSGIFDIPKGGYREYYLQDKDGNRQFIKAVRILDTGIPEEKLKSSAAYKPYKEGEEYKRVKTIMPEPSVLSEQERQLVSAKKMIDTMSGNRDFINYVGKDPLMKELAKHQSMVSEFEEMFKGKRPEGDDLKAYYKWVAGKRSEIESLYTRYGYFMKEEVGPLSKIFKSAELQQATYDMSNAQFDEVRELALTDPKKAKDLYNKFMEGKKTKDIKWWKNFTKTGTKFDKYKISGPDALFTKILEELNRRREKKAAGLIPTTTVPVGSTPVYHHGGVVSKTGPIFAQKGEVIYPKHFAEGGPVHDSIKEKFDVPNVAKTLNTTVEINVNAKSLEDAIAKLEGLELKVEDKELKVEDKELKIEEKEIKYTVEVDGAAAAEKIQAAINNSRVSVDGGVGADTSDVITHLTDRVNSLNLALEDTNRKITELDSEETIDIHGTVNTIVSAEMSVINRKLGDIDSKMSDLTSNINNQSYVTKNAINEVERNINTLRTNILI